MRSCTKIRIEPGTRIGINLYRDRFGIKNGITIRIESETSWHRAHEWARAKDNRKYKSQLFRERRACELRVCIPIFGTERAKWFHQSRTASTARLGNEPDSVKTSYELSNIGAFGRQRIYICIMTFSLHKCYVGVGGFRTLCQLPMMVFKSKIYSFRRPTVTPGFDAFQLSAPLLGVINPEGQWYSCKPCLEEDKLRSLVEIIAASRGEKENSSCCKCLEESKGSSGGRSQYIPVIMMPIYSAESCPFDIECALKKAEESDKTRDRLPAAAMGADQAKAVKKKEEKVVFTLQRLTDFDLLSQWDGDESYCSIIGSAPGSEGLGDSSKYQLIAPNPSILGSALVVLSSPRLAAQDPPNLYGIRLVAAQLFVSLAGACGLGLLTPVVTNAVTMSATDGLRCCLMKTQSLRLRRPAFELYRTRCFKHLLFAKPARRGLSSCLLAGCVLGLICVRISSQSVTATGFAYI
ncbi:hypothetical protein EVAR_66543_1 [Eumeta japonica]|uniref:Uncharacterized protein n=1 Tax=Eumeta variegata TaxID=151549 RepID=A0A4C1ZZ86_EUMVA|nr:hypothetical protein EVAR_66543_1 [Eumeta japonica]